MAVSKSNVIGSDIPAVANRTFADVRGAFRKAGELAETYTTSAIDQLRLIVESSAPVGKNGKAAAISDAKECGTLYDDFQSARKAKSVGNYVAPDKKAREKQVEKFRVGFNFATGTHKNEAVRVFNDTYTLLLGDVDTGTAGLGGRVYTQALSVLRKHGNLDKAMSKAEIKAFLNPDKDDTLYVVDVLKGIDGKIKRELGMVKTSPATMPLPKDVSNALSSMLPDLAKLIVTHQAIKTVKQAEIKARKEKAAAKK